MQGWTMICYNHSSRAFIYGVEYETEETVN